MTARFTFFTAICGAVWMTLALPMAAVSLAAEEAAPAADMSAAAQPAGQTVLRVQLGADGNVPGMVSVLDGAARQPIRATVSVFQGGLMLTTTHSNDRGRFQLPGLRPGVYSVIADAGKRFGVFSDSEMIHMTGTNA